MDKIAQMKKPVQTKTTHMPQSTYQNVQKEIDFEYKLKKLKVKRFPMTNLLEQYPS